MADLFTHAWIHRQENGPPETVFEGREEALRLYEMSTRRYDDTGTPKTHHITTNARIEGRWWFESRTMFGQSPFGNPRAPTS